MDEIRTTGKTVDDALTEALIQLGTTSDQVDVEIIDKGSKGFLGFGAKDAVIVVKRKVKETEIIKPSFEEEMEKEKKEISEALKKKEMPVKEEAVSREKKENSYKKEYKKPPVKEENEVKKQAKKPYSSSTPAEKTVTKSSDGKAVEKKKYEKKVSQNDTSKTEKKPAVKETVKKEETKQEEKPVKVVTPLDGEKTKEKINGFLNEVFQTMKMEVEVKIQVDEANRSVYVDMSGDEMGVLIGKRGQTLDSLQYLISLVANRDEHEYVRVKLDTENYRRRRRATLENLAKNIAYKVKRERKSITLEPMNPYERRIIHSTLQNDRYVETHSEGVEPYRRVVVSLKKNVDK